MLSFAKGRIGTLKDEYFHTGNLQQITIKNIQFGIFALLKTETHLLKRFTKYTDRLQNQLNHQSVNKMAANKNVSAQCITLTSPIPMGRHDE